MISAPAPALRSAVLLGSLAAASAGCGAERDPQDAAVDPRHDPPTVAFFSDATAESGLDFRHRSGAAGEYYFPEIMGAGVGLLDYDRDGDLDVYLVQGGALRGGAQAGDGGASPEEARDRLFRNDLYSDGAGGGRLRFTDVTEAAGLHDGDYGMGVAAGDYDHDGWVDLFVANFGSDRLLRNRGDGTFEDTTRAAGVADPRWSVSASFLDFDRDGWLDLFVAEYVDATVSNHKECRAAAGYRDYCGPLTYPPLPSRLLRNQRDGTFRDVSEAAGLEKAYGGALGVIAGDLDADGWVDLYVANDQSANQLWLNRHDGTFADDALLRGAALDVNGQPQASMGVDLGDLDGDGDDDIFLSHLTGETDTLYVNDGSGAFRDATAAAGLAAPGLAYTGFGTAFLDVDNDGWLDLLVVNGAVTIVEELLARGEPHPFDQPSQLLRNLGDGRFEDASSAAGPALALPATSRGAAFGDLDDDGDVDVVIAVNDGPARVLRNEVGSGRAWLGLRLTGRAPGALGERDQLGARVELGRTAGPLLVRRSRADGSYASANDPRVLFGLGRPPDGGLERVTVTWPDGGAESWDGLAAGRYHTLRRGEGVTVDRDGAGTPATTTDRGGAEPDAGRGAHGGDAVAVATDAPATPAADLSRDVSRLEPARLEPAVAAQIARAREAAARAGASDIERGAALGELGRVYHAYELHDAAARSYRAAEALDATGGRWAYHLGALEQRRGRPQEAIAALRRALDVEPGSLPAWLRLGDQELELGRVAAAREAFAGAAAIDGEDAAVLYGLGRLAQAEEDWAAARRLFERTLARQPDATLVHYALAQSCRELGDTAAARRHLALAGQGPVRFRDDAMAQVDALRSGAAAHLAAGARAYTLRDYARAIEEHRLAVAADPASVEARLGLASSLQAAGDGHAEAAAVLREAARLAPDRAGVRYAVGLELAKLGASDEAAEHLQRAVELAPANVEARLWLADRSARESDWPGALEQYEAVLASEPARADVRVKTATVLYVQSRHREAKAHLEAALEAAPLDPLARTAMARLLASCPELSLRDGERALALAQSLFDAEESIENAELVAMAHAQVGDFALAAAWQRRALDAASGAGAAQLASALRRNLARYERGETCCE